MELKLDTKQIFSGRLIKIASAVILALVVLLLVFRLGMLVGYRKAGFAYGWGDNYERNFGGRQGGFGMMGEPGGFLRDFDDRRFMGADGTVGKIIKITDGSIVVKGQADEEKIILLTDKTIISRLRDKIKTSALKVDDQIVVIGEPNQAGQIEAKLIRLLPAGLPGAPGLNQLPVQPAATGTATSTKIN